MDTAKKYSGSCHCGKVSYDVTLTLGDVIACNCSICRRTGTLLTFVPEDQFVLKSGEDDTTDYVFNNHIIHHHFCSTCGVRSFARGVAPDGKKTVAINARCLDGVDPWKLSVMHFDGAS